MTPLTVPVDGSSTGGFWLSVSELAASKGISKQAVSKRLDGFVAAGLVSIKSGPRNSTLINVAEYDKAAGEIGDTLRTVIGKDPVSAEPAEPSSAAVLTTERARREGYQAEIARLDLEERQRKLLPIGEVEHASIAIAASFVRSIETLPTKADDMAAAIAKDGVNGARLMLKAIAFDLRERFAKDLRLLAAPPVGEHNDDDAGDPTDRLT